MSDIQMIVFDFDGVLVRLFAGVGTEKLCNNLNSILQKCGPEDVYRRTNQLSNPFDIMRIAKNNNALSEKCFSSLAAAISEYELTAAAKSTILPDVHETLGQIKTLNTPVSILSDNSLPAIERALKVHGLNGVITSKISGRSADWSDIKPEPSRLLGLLKSAGLEPDQVLLVGDNAVDIDVANAVGVTPAWFPLNKIKIESTKSVGEGIVLDKLTDVLEYLRNQ